MDDGDGGRDHVDGPSYLSLSWYRFHADARADEQCSRQNSKYQSVRLLYLYPPRMAQHLQILPRALRESVSFSELTSGMIISKCGNKFEMNESKLVLNVIPTPTFGYFTYGVVLN